MDLESEALNLRRDLTRRERTADLRLTIDPGFVHHRKVETVVGEARMRRVDELIALLPPLPEGLHRVRVNHIYTRELLRFCQADAVPALGEVLAELPDVQGYLFCSTERLEPSQHLSEVERAVSRIELPGNNDVRVELHYSTAHITSDTTRIELRDGGLISIVAELREFEDGILICHPLVMGGPWLEAVEAELFQGVEFWSYSYFENFVEDIDEFARVADTPSPTDFEVMRNISEVGFKQCLAEILGDEARRDWGGETSDHFSAHIHLGGKRTTAAFLLKGPSRFAPMGMNHLGKNNDQIYRLAQEPADLLVVQHCHEILPPVRATLRAFAVQPGSRRRYCLIDGRDSLRLLLAFDKLERAVDLSHTRPS
jgi:hypothetical protein